jgi:hypothetical protein
MKEKKILRRCKGVCVSEENWNELSWRQSEQKQKQKQNDLITFL